MQRDADLFAENENRETPCDCAEKQHHKELALCLESQMVFSLVPEAEGIEAEYAALDRREVQAQPITGVETSWDKSKLWPHTVSDFHSVCLGSIMSRSVLKWTLFRERQYFAAANV